MPQHALTDKDLFDGHSALFASLLAGVDRYGEYGMGQSTLAVARASSVRIQAVDTALAWRDRVWADLDESQRERTQLFHIDLGEVGNWGFPKSYEHRDRFPMYFDGPWADGFDPQLVLIDGRFRVACFLTSLLRAKPGTLLLFDDYTDRAYYHIVEEVLRPLQQTERQAVFEVPALVDTQAISTMLAQFCFVMD